MLTERAPRSQGRDLGHLARSGALGTRPIRWSGGNEFIWARHRLDSARPSQARASYLILRR